jgi:hypothetical protein
MQSARVVHRTFPQPDSPQANIGPRERTLAVLTYVIDLNPDVFAYRDRIQRLFEGAAQLKPHDGAVAVLATLGFANPPDHPLFACIKHAFEQEHRTAKGEPLLHSLVPMLEKGKKP